MKLTNENVNSRKNTKDFMIRESFNSKLGDLGVSIEDKGEVDQQKLKNHKKLL